jgi:SulP family sulfate permease
LEYDREAIYCCITSLGVGRGGSACNHVLSHHFRDLTKAIVAGIALGSLLFIHCMSESTAVNIETPFVGADMADNLEPRGA